jgi:peptidoglycan/LPS O-acetylase OafA/YrhL
VSDRSQPVAASIPVSRSSYRPEVDGLRALAVVAVIVNHFHKELLPSGYLGVDIFFVISGFVITASFARHSHRDLSDLLMGFYARRLKRILPALVVVVVVSALAITMVDPNPGTSLLTGITSLFGFSNIYLFSRLTDYFAASTDLNVFLHTWSLGVEEQFYLIYPLLVWWSGFGRGASHGTQRLILLLLPCLLLSLLAFVYLYPRSQPHAYFLTSSRFWELASGCLICLAPTTAIAGTVTRIPSMVLLAGLIGTFALPLTAAVPATVLSVLLTSLLILGLRPAGMAYRVLSLRHVVIVGLLSYSLYLWHWPVLALSRWTIGIHLYTVPLQLLLILGLSWLSYRYIETPFRLARHPVTRLRTILLSMLSSLSATLLLVGLGKGLGDRLFLGQQNQLQRGFTSIPGRSAAICNLFAEPTSVSEFPRRCGAAGRKERPSIYLFGDSQIEQFAPAISALASRSGFDFHGIWGNACPFPALPELSSRGGRAPRRCLDGQRAVETTARESVKQGDVVFIGSYLTAYFDRKGHHIDGPLDQVRQTYLARLLETAETLVAQGASVVIYLNGPRFDGLEGAVEGYCFPQWFKPELDPACSVPAASFHTTRRADFAPLFRWADGSRRILWDGADSTTCRGTTCEARHYKDEAHFRPYYANYLFHLFSQRHPGLFDSRVPSKRSSEPGRT